MTISQIVNSIYESNTYLIKDDSNKCCVLIDCGDIEPILKEIDDYDLKAVFITHSHYDHIYGLNVIYKYFPLSTVYVSENGYKGLQSEKYNLSRYHNKVFRYAHNNICITKNGDIVDVGDFVVEIIETQGHDWSSQCFKIGTSLFTGDSYLPQYRLMTTFPKGDKIKGQESLNMIMKMANGCDVHPGHGRVLSFKDNE